jgi:hypothetical protein
VRDLDTKAAQYRGAQLVLDDGKEKYCGHQSARLADCE